MRAASRPAHGERKQRMQTVLFSHFEKNKKKKVGRGTKKQNTRTYKHTHTHAKHSIQTQAQTHTHTFSKTPRKRAEGNPEKQREIAANRRRKKTARTHARQTIEK